MSKYSAPPVTLRDVLAALPPVLPPLAWRVVFYPSPRGPDWSHAAVELVHNGPDAAVVTYKRWGKTVGTKNLLTLFQGLLLCAHEAHGEYSKVDMRELVKLVEWQVAAGGNKVRGSANG